MLEEALEQAKEELKERREKAIGLKKAFVEAQSKRSEETERVAEANGRIRQLERRIEELEAQLTKAKPGEVQPQGERQERNSQDRAGIIGVLQGETEALRNVAKRESDLRQDMQKKLQAAQLRYNDLWGQHLQLLAHMAGEWVGAV
jgi:chromosome segregation ATPase